MLIYSDTVSTRLQYISKFLIQEQLGVTVTLTTNLDGFMQHEGPKLNYSNRLLPGEIFNLQPHRLLFENDLRDQAISCLTRNGNKAFFGTNEGDFPFDVFAASFYLLSRYEEWLPHTKDLYGRYAHENSLAFREGFLSQPLVNHWIKDFAAHLKHRFPNLKFNEHSFQYTPTYDIDIAWSYKSKGLLRNVGGFFSTPSLERLKVLCGLQKDPFDCYQFLDGLHEQYHCAPVYFFLAGTTRTRYDKNISPYSHNMWQLIKRHAKKYSVGLHPSWKSNENIDLLQKEKKILETAGEVTVARSRQHYIQFSLPDTFTRLLDIGIRDDYSMGYGSINGFRASVASSFYWYDLSSESVTPLRLHPFCFMDANSYYEQKQNADDSFKELDQFVNACRAVDGHLITIFHNHFLGTAKKFEGWRDAYTQFISRLQQSLSRA